MSSLGWEFIGSWLAALVKVGGVGSWVYVRVVGSVRSSFFLRVSSFE
jgi:hypothetical protein